MARLRNRAACLILSGALGLFAQPPATPQAAVDTSAPPAPSVPSTPSTPAVPSAPNSSAPILPSFPTDAAIDPAIETAAQAETSPNREADAFEADGPPLAVTRISLGEMIVQLLKHNPQVQRARLAWEASGKAARAAWGAYEPELVASLQQTEIERERGRFVEGNQEYNLEVEGNLVTGTRYNLGFSLRDYENSVYTLDDPNAFAGLTLTQPLLKGVWHSAPMANIRLSSAERKIAYHGFRGRVMQTLREAEEAYWQLVFAETKYRYADESVASARQLVRDSEARLQAKKMSALDTMEAHAGLAYRLAARAEARQEFLEAAHNLRMLLARENGAASLQEGPSSPAGIGASGILSASTDLAVSPADSGAGSHPDTSSMRLLHPDYLIRKLEVEKEDVGVRFRTFQNLPELNLRYRYGYNGVGNTGEQALYEMGERVQETRSWGLELRAPLFLGLEPRNQLSRARIQRRMAKKNLNALAFELQSTLRLLADRAGSQFQRAQHADRVVHYRLRLLAAEKANLYLGKSNSRLVIEAEERLAQARQWALESKMKFRISRLHMSVAAGTLLREKGLEDLKSGRPVLATSLAEPD